MVRYLLQDQCLCTHTCASPLSSGLLPTVIGIIIYLLSLFSMVISQGTMKNNPWHESSCSCMILGQQFHNFTPDVWTILNLFHLPLFFLSPWKWSCWSLSNSPPVGLTPTVGESWPWLPWLRCWHLPSHVLVTMTRHYQPLRRPLAIELQQFRTRTHHGSVRAMLESEAANHERQQFQNAVRPRDHPLLRILFMSRISKTGQAGEQRVARNAGAASRGPNPGEQGCRNRWIRFFLVIQTQLSISFIAQKFYCWVF